MSLVVPSEGIIYLLSRSVQYLGILPNASLYAALLIDDIHPDQFTVFSNLHTGAGLYTKFDVNIDGNGLFANFWRAKLVPSSWLDPTVDPSGSGYIMTYGREPLIWFNNSDINYTAYGYIVFTEGNIGSPLLVWAERFLTPQPFDSRFCVSVRVKFGLKPC